MISYNRRRRVALACDSCRERKVRCDGAKPICGTCRARKRQSLCVYQLLGDNGKAGSEREYVQSLLARINLLEQQVRQKGDDCHTSSPYSTPSTALATDGRGVSSSSVPLASTSDTLPRYRENPLTFTSSTTIPSQHDASPVNAMGAAVPARMVNDSLNVNKQYYGQSSIVSLLRQASRDRTRTENSQHAETQQAREARHVPSTTTTAKSASVELLHDQFCLPPRRVTDGLLDIYRKEAHIFHPWVHFDSFTALYRSIWSGDDLEEVVSDLPDIGLGGSNCPTTVFYCALNAMLAEACQFSDIPPQDKRSNSTMFYERARTLLQVDLLDSGSLSHIQTLLLVAQYLQCTEFATQCWNLVGMAYRMSVAIGLHHEEKSTGLSSLEREMRRRTWHACLQMELIMSMTMGRPVQLGVEHNVPLPLAIDDEYLSPTRCDCRQPDSIVSRNQYLVESLKLVQVLSQVLSTMYNATRDEEQKVSSGVPTSTMRAKLMDMLQIEASLDTFESSLHPSLKWDAYCSSMAANDVFVRQSNVLHARILHLKLLLHRPALSLYCSPKGSSDPSSEITSGLNRFPNPYPADSAVACVKAACGLIDVIHRAVVNGSASAWWYCVFYLISGSLVLALAESRDELVARLEANTLESAWSKCDQALCRMAKLVDGPVQDYATALRELRRRATERDRQQPEASQRENGQSVSEQAPTNQFESAGKTALQYETLHSQLRRQSHTFMGDLLQEYLDPPALQNWDAILNDVRLSYLAPEREDCPIPPGLY
ncbi:Zn(2)-C6 fungal-type domain-containing protein [Trichoderma simmonsii]|uniref:Zn(2)-C6 fungal-type domain-containing protein n=1 Tax=Trichoderma simmonsii TaxID=1491479 RepID=A0A8G0LFV4_9HYPO|nr:Zn(2)-C6 fungal-type domain-containing protein [Trichoderma simmonsii]